MLGGNSKGVESLPVVLLLGVALAACTLGLGFRCLGNVQTLRGRQHAIESFDTFVERARMVSAGGVGSTQQVNLELIDGRISVDAELVQLSIGNEVLRSEILPLPIHAGDVEELRSGTYVIRLQRDAEDGYFLEVEEV